MLHLNVLFYTGHYKQWTRVALTKEHVGQAMRVTLKCIYSTRDTINSGPGDPGPRTGDTRTRRPKDLQLLRETEMQLQAKLMVISLPGVCESAWHKSEDFFSIQHYPLQVFM